MPANVVVSPSVVPRTPALVQKPVAALGCLEWGSFTLADSKQAEKAIEALALGERLGQRRTEEAAHWWVFIPPLASRQAALRKAADEMRVGDGSEHGTVMGPIINTEAKKRILNYIEIGEQEGAKLARDGRKDLCCDSDGYFVGPTIFDNVKPSMRIAREEIFGPVLSVVRAKTLDEALEVVNGSEYGNASSIFTKSGQAAREFSSKVQTGMVGINVGVPAPVAIFPFTGWKGSFFGDLHALGKDGVKFYTETRVVTCRW